MIRRSTHSTGFSLVETLVAITVLLVLIVGPMSVTVRSTRSATLATEQATAYFLAQEGLELAQKVRDDLLLAYLDNNSVDAWTQFTDDSGGTLADCYQSGGCGLVISDDDTGTVDVVDCAGDACAIYRNDAENSDRARFAHDDSYSDTPYTREITLEAIGAREVKVSSKVTWRTGSINSSQEVTVDTYLFNLYDAP